MESNWSTFAWIGGLVVFYVLGLIEGRIRGYRKRKAEETRENGAQPSSEPETVTVQVDDPGLLRIKSENGAFALDLDGQRVDLISMSDDERKRLNEVLNVVRPLLDPLPAPVTLASTAQMAAPPLIATPQLTKRKPGVKEDRPAPPALSIVSQIDSMLQARLAGTPLDERGIVLAESREGGVMVYVGSTRYDTVDEIPDPEVKAAIRAAITEWENKYTPGLR